MQLTDNQRQTINICKLKTDNNQQFINICENLTPKQKKHKMRKFIIVLSSKLMIINPVQYWYESHNFTENK